MIEMQCLKPMSFETLLEHKNLSLRKSLAKNVFSQKFLLYLILCEDIECHFFQPKIQKDWKGVS